MKRISPFYVNGKERNPGVKKPAGKHEVSLQAVGKIIRLCFNMELPDRLDLLLPAVGDTADKLLYKPVGSRDRETA